MDGIALGLESGFCWSVEFVSLSVVEFELELVLVFVLEFGLELGLVFVSGSDVTCDFAESLLRRLSRRFGIDMMDW